MAGEAGPGLPVALGSDRVLRQIKEGGRAERGLERILETFLRRAAGSDALFRDTHQAVHFVFCSRPAIGAVGEGVEDLAHGLGRKRGLAIDRLHRGR